jgi:mediator of RNA polymerase II transcription subunit 6
MDSLEEGLRRQLEAHKESTSVSWYCEPWLKENSLDDESVMRYFYMSVFYDSNANNEKTKEDLKKMQFMKGLEYELCYSRQNLGIFHIKKQYRSSEKKVTPIAIYYVYNGRIYEAPSVSKVISSKLRNISYYLRESLDFITQSAENNKRS